MNAIRKPQDVVTKKTLTALIYGQPAIGKTTLACGADNAVLLDFDGGVSRINAQHVIDTLQVESWQDVIDNSQELLGYSTIIVDTVGKMLDCIGRHICTENPKYAMGDGSLTLKGYGARKTKFVQFTQWLNCSGKNVIYLAHEKEEKQKVLGDEVTTKRPDIGNGASQELMKDMDLVGYMQAIGSSRTITFDCTEQYYAKNTCNLHGQWNEVGKMYLPIPIPTIIDANGSVTEGNDFIKSVIDAYVKLQECKDEKRSQYIELTKNIADEVENSTNAEDLNRLMAMYTDEVFEHIYDSKRYASMMINSKAKKLNLNYNKESKCYEV